MTIRPAGKHRPVLTLGETSDPDAALFRLHDGKLNLVDLAFRLRPKQAEFKAQAVVMLAGDGQCTFKNCMATLEASKEVRVALATLADPSVVMKMMAAQPSGGAGSAGKLLHSRRRRPGHRPGQPAVPARCGGCPGGVGRLLPGGGRQHEGNPGQVRPDQSQASHRSTWATTWSCSARPRTK